jgi:hypothetical protein
MATCDKCQKEIAKVEGYIYYSRILCEDCYIDICMPRTRKTHWQYLRSIKTDYLIFANTK